MIDDEGNVTIDWVAPTHEPVREQPARMSKPFCVCRECGQADRCDRMRRADGRSLCAKCANKE